MESLLKLPAIQSPLSNKVVSHKYKLPSPVARLQKQEQILKGHIKPRYDKLDDKCGLDSLDQLDKEERAKQSLQAKRPDSYQRLIGILNKNRASPGQILSPKSRMLHNHVHSYLKQGNLNNGVYQIRKDFVSQHEHVDGNNKENLGKKLENLKKQFESNRQKRSRENAMNVIRGVYQYAPPSSHQLSNHKSIIHSNGSVHSYHHEVAPHIAHCPSENLLKNRNLYQPPPLNNRLMYKQPSSNIIAPPQQVNHCVRPSWWG